MRLLVLCALLLPLRSPRAQGPGAHGRVHGRSETLRNRGHHRSASARVPLAGNSPQPRGQIRRLARGVKHFEVGEYRQAVRELTPLAADRSLRSRDYLLYVLGQSEAMVGERAAARQRFRAVVALGRSTPLFALAQARAADMAFELGLWDEAKTTYRRLLDTHSDDIEPAVARWRLAEIAQRGGQSAAEIATLREVAVLHPEHPLAERALTALASASVGLSPADRIERARRLTGDRLWERALAELAQLPADLPPALRNEADYWQGTTQYRTRHHYAEAATVLLGVAERLDGPRRTDALFHGARALSRIDQDDRAIAGYRDLIARFPHAREAPEAAFLIGWLDYNRGHYAQAIPAFSAMLDAYRHSSFADDAQWYRGLSHWLLGQTSEALVSFGQIARRGGAYDGAKGRYWRARALDRLGRTDEAIAEWRDLVADYPLRYYALQARARLRDHGIHVAAFASEGPPAGPLWPLGPVAASIERRAAADTRLRRVDELLEAGLTTAASLELRRSERALLQRYRPARILPLLLDRYTQARDFHRVHRLAAAYGSAALYIDPQRVPAARAWWQAIYPLAYRPEIERYSPSGNNPRYYLYTIMQKESAYNPYDVSYADAIGLLQMIPPTSRRVAAIIGRSYSDDALYHPDDNIALGAWYIGHLLGKFNGQIALGAGSYNAGPRAMRRWLDSNGHDPLDLFIERCSYTQTREYMKKTLDIYAHYLYLYDKQDYFPEPHIDPAVLDDGIEY